MVMLSTFDFDHVTGGVSA